jgi:NAD(P)-dependent dehydrogenase (short-subunit alcohol dehydrogenase family)
MTVSAAVVTGGASGFGREVAVELAASGSDVALLDIDGARARAEASAIAARHHVRAVGRAVDVSSADELSAAAAAVTDELGRCDLLWVNVGVQHFGSIETTSEDVWRWVLDVNLVGAARTVQAFLPLLRAADTATIAFTASANVLAPAARLGAYQASKCGLVGLAETLRMELAADGIGVSIIYPSGMTTRHLESSAEARPIALGPGNVSDEDLAAMMASRPMSDADLTTAEERGETRRGGGGGR